MLSAGYLFCLLFAILALIRAYEYDGDVLVLTEATFDEAVNEYSHILVEFYAPWCGHCKTLAPEWAKAATQLKENNAVAKLAKVDATENTKLAERFGIKGFPTIKFYKNGAFSADYQAGRTAPDIVSWATKKSGPAFETIASVADFDSFQEKNTVFVLGAFTSADSAAATVFKTLCDGDMPHKFALTTNADVLAQLGLTVDTVVVFKNFDENRVDLAAADADVDALKNFIVGQTTPLVQEFTQATAKNIFSSSITKHFLFFTDKSKDHHDDAFKVATEIANKNRGKMLVVNVPVSEKRVLDYFGVTEENLPAVVIADMSSGNSVKKYIYSGDFKDSGDYADKFLAGELKPELKSEIVSPSDKAGPVVILKGKSFNEIVLESKENVFVEFYAPWCGHCKKLAPIWDELGEHFEDSKNVVIAKMDSTANEVDVPGLEVRGFPTLYFFKAGDKANPIKYDGARELEDFIDFIDETAAKVSHDEL